MRTIYTFLLCCLFHPLVRARIGEDETTIVVRYGKPVETVPTADPHLKAQVYSAAGFKITVFLLNGIAGGEQYEKTDGGNALSEQEISTLLKANSNGGEWKEDGGNQDYRLWLLNGTHTFASYPKHDPRKVLIVSTMEAALKAKEAVKATQDKNLQNF